MVDDCLTRLRQAQREAQRLVAAKQTVNVFQSISVLTWGFDRFQERTMPSSLSGVSFLRIAGQAACLSHNYEFNSRSEILRLLGKIKPGGVFLMLGHGGIAKCGAVAAKQAQLEGQLGNESEPVIRLLDHVSPEVGGQSSPHAEETNAVFQALKIMDDQEFNAIIQKKNLSVVWAVCSSLGTLKYHALNRPNWDQNKLFERHPKLLALSLQMQKGLKKFLADDHGNLDQHYAHAAFLFDPLEMRTVLDPFELLLDIGGICCVDARVTPNTPDGYKYLFRLPPNRAFAVTIETGNGNIFSQDDIASLVYSFGHVSGVNSLTAHGEKGNGHTPILTTDMSLAKAEAVKTALLVHEIAHRATRGGETITLMGFDGKALRIVNSAQNIDFVLPYNPQVNILSIAD